MGREARGENDSTCSWWFLEMSWWGGEDEMSAGGASEITTPGALVTFRHSDIPGLEEAKFDAWRR